MPRCFAICSVSIGASLLGACSPSPPATPPPAPRNQIERMEFNRLAVRHNLPIYWIADANGNKTLDAEEATALLFYPPYAGDLDAAYGELLAAKRDAAPDAATPDGARRALVRQELDQGRATLVFNDLAMLSPADKAFAGHMLKVAGLIDTLYATQSGAAALAAQLPTDVESRSLFRRNGGPKCEGPLTQKNPACSAIPGAPEVDVDVYPAKLGTLGQRDDGFCELLHKSKGAAALDAPFTVVRASGAKLEAIPYSTAYATQMVAIANELEAAAQALADANANEAPLIAYLRAAAGGFRSNDWWPADEAWSRMNVDNSRWYVRVGPDETYWEPCSIKAGFHLTLALINQGSRQWQQKLAAIQQEMEAAIAQRAGAPYVARKVQFHLPDFIDIVANAGDDRGPFGATIGQSLPNVGPVAKESRGRTVAMVNLFSDPDSMASGRTSAESLLDSAAMANYSESPLPGQLATILHEATHNLGPAQEYKVRGTPVISLLGGPYSQLVEELKAQTGALYFIELLRSKGILSDTLALQTYTDCITWAFGHVSSGMYDEPGHRRRPYPQLAAIQLGFLLDHGALSWDPAALAANGQDKGAFTIHMDKMVVAANALMTTVAGIKARGDRKALDALVARYVDGDAVPQATIRERLSRKPRASLVYAVKGL